MRTKAITNFYHFKLHHRLYCLLVMLFAYVSANAQSMTYVSSEVSQITAPVNAGTNTNQVISVQIITSLTGTPIDITQFDLSTAGTTNLANISNVKVWYSGSSPWFTTNDQFGTTLAVATVSPTITGIQSLQNGANYFWVTYDIASGSTIANTVDAGCSSFMIGGSPEVPTNSSPSGSRAIRADYCVPILVDGFNSCANWGEFITSFSTSGALSDVSNLANGCAGNTNNNTFFDEQVITAKQNTTFQAYIETGNSWLSHSVWIDFNQDGIFNNTDERVYMSSNGNTFSSTGDIYVPCTALTGPTRMRVRAAPFGYMSIGAPDDPCNNMGEGETEDYTIIIAPNPIVYSSTAAQQVTGSTYPGEPHRAVLRIPVQTLNCGDLASTSFVFSTTGTTSNADITAAYLYQTGSSNVFNSSKLLGTVASPGSQFSFAVTDTLEANQNTYYWLAYDVSASAVLGNVIDGVLDSLEVAGTYYTPVTSSPAGSIDITTPMTFVSAEGIQTNFRKAARGAENNEVIGIHITMSAAGASVKTTSLDLSANGTTDTSEIRNLKVWYTGNSNIFDATNQFGSTLNVLPGSNNFTITGDQGLLNGDNYFWLTYDINGSAVIGNVIDGEVTGMTVHGAIQAPSVTAPAGNREIREEYCTPLLSNGFNSCMNWGENINTVSSTGAISDMSNVDNGCAGNANNYTYFNGMEIVAKQNTTFQLYIETPNNWMSHTVWIDYDQDGVFNNAEERVFRSLAGNNYSSSTATITIPCGAVPGPTRMRVRAAFDGWIGPGSPDDPCSDFDEGESEDYDVMIIENPIVFDNAIAEQESGTTYPGESDKKILHIPVQTIGCGDLVSTSFAFSTTGTTNITDITTAYLYKTGVSGVFNTSNLIGTVSSPASQFVFTVTDTLEANEITHYWLAYDVSASSVLGNVIDGVLDSIEVGGVYYTPGTGSPANITITTPMAFVSAEGIQTNSTKAPRGTENNEVIGIHITMAATGASVKTTSLDLSATGTTDTSEIRNLKVWYTGSSNTFDATNQFGSTLNILPGSNNFTITGDQGLLNGDNYFWLTYDIDGSAVLGNVIDGEVTGMTVHGAIQAPSISAPAGNREIREEYCTPLIGSGFNSCMSWGSTINTVSTSGAVVDFANVDNGCAGNANNFSYFKGTIVVAKQNAPFDIYIETPNNWMSHTVWIDYDQDGIFNNAEERVFRSATGNNYFSSTGTITVPCGALTGATRMRVRATFDGMINPGSPDDPCIDFFEGEGEDYDVMIIENPILLDNVTAEQETSTTYPGEPHKKILHIPVQTIGCGDLVSTSFALSTSGTTNNADITTAYLYKTGAKSGFNTNNLVATVVSPGSQFVFTLADTLEANQTTHYWLAYDVSASAALANVLDARVDSIEVGGVYYMPVTGSPAGNITITNPMTFVDAEGMQTNTTKAGKGTANNEVLGIHMEMSGTGASVNATQLDLSANGTTDTSGIRNLKVWYTGSSSSFAKVNQFGSTLDMLPGSNSFTMTGEQALLNGDNYFWLTYDIDPSATVGDVIDGEVSGVTVHGLIQIPSVTSPVGNREIRDDYCTPFVGSGFNSCMNWGEYINTVSTSGAIIDFSNENNGCAGNPNNNTYFEGTTVTIQQNSTFQVYIETPNSWLSHSVWIDYNQDGDFNNTDERVFMSSSGNTFSSTATITVPCSALPGPTRMRVRAAPFGYMSPGAPDDACNDMGEGEGEDYDVIVLENPILFDNATAEQDASTTYPGESDKKILHIPVQTMGCGDLVSTSFALSTTGTTSNADIIAAYLYKTGTSGIFNTSNLVGTVVSPTSQFTFTVTDTLEANQTTHYWIAYDVSASSALGNVLDANLDSIEIGGVYYMPVTSSPAGNITITTPMTFVNAEGIHVNTSKAGRGTADNEVLGIRMEMSGTGASVNATELNLSANGTTDTSEIRNLKVWYTGSSNNFARGNQFGSTLSILPGSNNFTITGDQPLLNGDNYFWLTYDIDPTATVGNVIDGEVTGMTIHGGIQAPSLMAPAGNREIREDYCTPLLANGLNSCLNWNEYINTVSTNGAVVDFSNVNNSCAGNVNNNTYFAGTTVTVNKSESFEVYIETPNAWMSHTVWIDYDQDGIFNNTDERVFRSVAGSNYPSSTATITVPCTAKAGLTRMRVRAAFDGWNNPGSPDDPCADFGEGESEDYDVMIQNVTASYGSATAVQQTSIVEVATVNVTVLRVPVQALGCGIPLITSMKFNTAGSTNASVDIASAKLYRTDNSTTFNTSKLVGTVAAPSGAFSFTLTDTLLPADVTNYWLAYDISAGAVVGHIVDAVFDSVQVLGAYHTPTMSNPVGNVMIDLPMTYAGSTVTQTGTTKVAKGRTYNNVIGIKVETSLTGAPVLLSSLTLPTTGTTNIADITNLKVWYSGANSNFTLGNQFGSTVAAPLATQVVTGSQLLLNGSNYFWVTYDIAVGATVGNVIDGECTSLTVAGAAHVPSVTAPAGNRQIKAQYCTPATGGTPYITNVTFGDINNSPAPPTGPTYRAFIPTPGNTTAVPKGSAIELSVSTQDFTHVSVWIDFNDDGTFNASEWTEVVFESSPGVPSVKTIVIPASAVEGQLTMRIMSRASFNPNTDPCRTSGSGEAQDYTITILPQPAPTSYVWNQTGTASFISASNWTPSRTTPNQNDILVFNGGGNVTAEDVPQQTISQLTVDNATNVTLTSGAADLTVESILALTSGSIIVDDGTVNVILGSSATSTGTLSGTGTVQGKLVRWIGTTLGSYTFPMSTTVNKRAITVDYTVAPATGGMLSVLYRRGAPGTTGLPVTDGGLTLTNISNSGVWAIRPDASLSGGTYTMTVNADNVSGVVNHTQTALLRRNISGLPWTALGTVVPTTGTAAAMVLSRTGMTGYTHEIGIAGTAVNPLPVTLTTFTASRKSADVLVSWNTSSEINNAGFEVERSTDGKSFEYVTFVKGAGNSNRSLTYGITDVKAFAMAHANTVYYRLKQIDADGKYTYSHIVRVVNSDAQKTQVSIYPNPFTSELNIALNTDEATSVKITVTDLQGRTIMSESIALAKGYNNVTLGTLANLARGAYFVKTELNGETNTFKLIKSE
jgi:hypothetical protein